MRLWSIHPSYLDSRGLCGLWREALLSQNALMGKTKGYKHHPQLQRFQKSDFPVGYVSQYLVGIAQEAFLRGYNFDETKIFRPNHKYTLTVTKGQLIYEFNHLQAKLFHRDKIKCASNFNSVNVEVEFINKDNRVYLTYTNQPFPYDLLKPHPMFTVIDGDIEEWEKIK